MRQILIVSGFLFVSCARISEQPGFEAPTPEEVAASRGGRVPDQIDSLIAKVVGMDAEFGESDSDVPAFYFTGRNDSAFKRLAVIPAAIPRLVDCLGWNRRSRSTWHGAPVLVGSVCGHVLLATPYAQTRRSDRRPRDRWESPWIDYRNPTIEKLRAAQAVWLRQWRSDPS